MNMEVQFPNFHPVSNVTFLSKTIERVIQGKLLKYVESTGNVEILQSAYKANHSTETSLIKVRTDILNAIQNKEVTCLILLNLSAAFDSIDHHLLLNHLQIQVWRSMIKNYSGYNPTLGSEDREGSLPGKIAQNQCTQNPSH